MSKQARSDARDNKRVFLYGVVAVVVVVLAALGYNLYSQTKQPGSIIEPNPAFSPTKATPDTTSPK